MNIYQFQKHSQENEIKEFYLILDGNKYKANWLDCWLGLIQFEGLEGFMMIKEVSEATCEEIK